MDAIKYVEQIVQNEINSVTDNPLLIDDDLILSGGNFHAQALALAADFLSIAVSELGSISERRSYQLVSGNRGLPDFLAGNPGLESGYMIVQYAVASIASLNKSLATPSSVDSIISSKAQEDHVSIIPGFIFFNFFVNFYAFFIKLEERKSNFIIRLYKLCCINFVAY